MAAATDRRKQFLFVDDDARFLAGLRDVFSEMARGTWDIFTASNHSQALALLRQQRVDVVVIDLAMPVMDGLQFLRLLMRTHPGQQAVILTGQATDDNRKACTDAGAALVLEKLIAPDGFAAVFSALDALAGAQPLEGFRGIMHRVGLQEVLQMECLSRKSSVLEVFAGEVRGRIFISDGAIVHADSGSLKGELALYGLLALRGGEFNFLPFTEPAQRSITGHWESLLMEAARLTDEGTQFFKSDTMLFGKPAATQPKAPPETKPGQPPGPARVLVDEVLLCSGSGEVLYDWECRSIERRVRLLEQIEQQTVQLSNLLPVGRFDRLEILTSDGRMICELQPNRRLFVHTRKTDGTR